MHATRRPDAVGRGVAEELGGFPIGLRRAGGDRRERDRGQRRRERRKGGEGRRGETRFHGRHLWFGGRRRQGDAGASGRESGRLRMGYVRDSQM